MVQGLNRYIKKKKYDDIESYLPALIAAQGQLVRSGYLMGACGNLNLQSTFNFLKTSSLGRSSPCAPAT